MRDVCGLLQDFGVNGEGSAAGSGGQGDSPRDGCDIRVATVDKDTAASRANRGSQHKLAESCGSAGYGRRIDSETLDDDMGRTARDHFKRERRGGTCDAGGQGDGGVDGHRVHLQVEIRGGGERAGCDGNLIGDRDREQCFPGTLC